MFGVWREERHLVESELEVKDLQRGSLMRLS